MSTSFIDSAITHISGSSSRHAGLATIVQQQDNDDPANRIALTAVALGYRRDEAKKANNEYGGCKPEQLLSFVQQVMNRVVWQSRKMSVLQTEEDENLVQRRQHRLDHSGSAMHVELEAIFSGKTRRSRKPENQPAIHYAPPRIPKHPQSRLSWLGTRKPGDRIKHPAGPVTGQTYHGHTGPTRRRSKRVNSCIQMTNCPSPTPGWSQHAASSP